MTFSPNLGLDYVQSSQAQKHITMNEALSKLDVLVQPVVEDLDFSNPPGSPVEGASYIVASPAGGVWATHENDIASYLNGSWVFYTPKQGWRVYVLDEDTPYDFDGTDWVIKSITSTALSNGSLLELGVNSGTTPDNRLSVKSNNVLFSHDDVTPGTGSMNTTINKALSGDAASITYQVGFSGRAIVGLLGNDDYTVRVSDDGTTFNDAFVVDGTTAKTDFKVLPSVNGDDFWHEGNDGAGSGLDADLLDGQHASDFAQLSGATFTGGITATGFTGNGGGLTGVNADNLGGQAASSYALLSGATFTGTVEATNFVGDGSSLTGVTATTLGGQPASAYALLSGATFTGGLAQQMASPSLVLETTEVSGEQSYFKMEGARTSVSATIAQIDFYNNGTGVEGTSAQWLIGGDGDVNLAIGQLQVAGGEVWHANNDGAGSGLDADLLDGNQASAFAQLSGAAFTGGVSATGFTGNGGGLTGVNATNLGGQSAASYALLAGATFTGTIDAPVVRVSGDDVWHEGNDGPGSGLNADLLDGVQGAAFAQLSGATFTGNIVNTSSQTLLGELGVGGATPDATNKFAFFGTDLLLNSSSSINMKYNKNAAANDASMTFQTGFTTYGLFGLLGNNDTTLKVGTGFVSALIANNTDGTMQFPEGVKHDAVTAYKNTNQTLTTSWATVTGYDGTHIAASGNLSWNGTNGDAFVGKAGRFQVSYTVSTEISTGSARTDSLARLERWTGAAWVEVEGTTHRMYNRIAGRGGSCASATVVLDVAASDGFRIAARIETGTDTVIVDQAALSILRL